MTLSALGIFSAAGAGGGVAGTYELIETVILGTDQASITFSNLGTYSSTYKHLQIRGAMKATSAVAAFMRFNGDTGNNYSWHYLEGNGGNVVSGASTTTNGMVFTNWPSSGASTLANGIVCDILDPYSTTKNKTTRNLNGRQYIQLYSGNWRSTDSVTSITVFAASDFTTGSRLSIYGLKG
jgi:hypothetical protein